MVGSVIQATEMMEYEDGMLIENHLKTPNGLHGVCTIPGALSGAASLPRFFWVQTEFQSAWVFMAV